MQGDATFDVCQCDGNCVGGDLAINPRTFCKTTLHIQLLMEDAGHSGYQGTRAYYCYTEPYASACRKTCGTCLPSPESECTDAQIANGGAISAQQCEQWARGANKRFSTSEFSKDVHTGIKVSEPPMHTYQLVAVDDKGLGSPNLNLAPWGGLTDGNLGGCRNCPNHHHNEDCSSYEAGLESCQRLCSFLDECAGIYFYTTEYPGVAGRLYRCCPLRELPELPGGPNDKTDSTNPSSFGVEIHRKQDPIPSSVPYIEFGSDRGFSLATWIYRTRTGNNWDRLFELDTVHASSSNYDAATNPYPTKERMSEWMFAFQYNGVLRAIPGTGYYTCTLNAANGFNLEVNNNRWVHFAVTVTPLGEAVFDNPDLPAGRVQFYIDGVPVPSEPPADPDDDDACKSFPLLLPNAEGRVGTVGSSERYPAEQESFDGLLADFHVFKYGLTEDDVAGLYASGTMPLVADDRPAPVLSNPPVTPEDVGRCVDDGDPVVFTPLALAATPAQSHVYDLSCDAAGTTCVCFSLPPPSPPSPFAPGYDTPLNHMEVWVSRERARWGTRAAQFEIDDVGPDGRIVLRLTEGSGTFSLDHAEGRFLFLRGFHNQNPDQQLKIGSVRTYRRIGRRLQEEEEQELEEETEYLVYEPEPPPSSPPPPPDLAALMLMDLTTLICNTTNEEDHHMFAQEAASVWANVRDPEGLHCYDCEHHVPVRCERFFAMLITRQSARTARRAQQRASARAHVEAQYKESMMEHMDKSCCRRHVVTGEVDCSRNYCMEAQKAATRAKTARVLRQLHESGHEEAQLGLAQLLATDGLSRYHHPHEPCRSGNLSLLSNECFSESLIHHVLKKHDMKRDEMDAYLGKAGLDLTQIVLSTMGVKQTISEKTQNWWRSKQDVGRRMQEEYEQRQKQPKRRMSTRAAPKTNAGVREFKRDMRSYLNKSAVHARNLQRLGGRKTRGRQPQVHSFLDTISAVVSQQSSMFRTFLHGGRKLADSWGRFPGRKKQVALTPKPTPGKKHIKGWFDHVESLVHEGRRLDENFGSGITVPPTAPDWLLQLDWPGIAEETHRIAKVLKRRDAHVLDHARRLQQLPHGDVAHETGHVFLDINAPPSAIGNALRRLAAWITDDSRGFRAFEEAEAARQLPRATTSEPSDVWEAVKSGWHPLQAAKQHLETTNRHLNTRRSLAESLFGGVARLPATTNAPVISRYGSYGNSGGGDIFKGIARYLLMDTALCYLYPIQEKDVDEFGDGTNIRMHRSSRLCFPAIPIIPPQGTKFRASLNLPADYDFTELEFGRACNTDAMKEILLTFGQPNDVTYTPIGLMLRFAEGIDSLRNLALTANMDLTIDERAGALVCSTAQLGGLLFAIIASCFALFALAFIPVFGAIGVCCCQLTAATRRRKQRIGGGGKNYQRVAV